MFCPNCGGQVTEDLFFCGECGYRLREQNAEQKNIKEFSSVKDDLDVIICKTCGEQFFGGVFCPKCGAKNERGVNADTINKFKTPQNEKPVKRGAIGIIKIIRSIASIVVTVIIIMAATGKLDKIFEELGRTELFGGASFKGITVENALDNIVAYYKNGDIDKENELATENSLAQNDFTSELQPEVESADNMHVAAEETNTVVKEDMVVDEKLEEGKVESEEYDYAYDMEWVGYYMRSKGPCSHIAIWSADEAGVEFAAGIGDAGYLAYRDLRDCMAEWINDTTAVYNDKYNGEEIRLCFNEDGTILVEEKGIDNDMILSLTGVYGRGDDTSLDYSGFVLPDSDSCLLNENDLENLSPIECKIARNEIYARHGRMFMDEQLQNYFESCSWYVGEVPAELFDIDILNDYERENAEMIAAYEEKMGYR